MSTDLTQEFYVAKLPPGGGAKLTELDLSRQFAAGRITGAEIVSRVEAGALRRTDLCWRQGLPSWDPIGQVFEAALGAPEPPPLPPAPEPPPLPTPVLPPTKPAKDTRWLALVVVVFWWLLTLAIVLAAVTAVVLLMKWVLP